MPRKHTPALQQKGVGFLTKGHQKSHPPPALIFMCPLYNAQYVLPTLGPVPGSHLSWEAEALKEIMFESERLQFPCRI